MIVGHHHEGLESLELGALAIGKLARHSFEKIERQARCRYCWENFVGERHLQLGGIGAGNCGAMMIDPETRAPVHTTPPDARRLRVSSRTNR